MHVPRQSTGTNKLAVAEAQRQALLQKSLDQVAHGPRIDDCIERFIAAHQSEINDKTVEVYKRQLERLRAYCERRGAYFMRDLTVDLLEDFKVDGLPAGLSAVTKKNIVAHLRCFLRVAFRRGWIDTSLAEKVAPHKAVFEQKEPYSDTEVVAILAEAEKLNGGREGYAGAAQTFRLLLELMLETGMRVSDAIRFEPTKLERGDSGLWIYTFTQHKRKRTKQPVPIEAYLSGRLKAAIDGCKWLSTNRPFWYGKSSGYTLAHQVHARMQTIGDRCGVADCRPHRLRDTFAIRALLRGVSIGDVSRLLGHSSVKVTETYYAKWVPARRRRLEAIVAQSLVNS